MAAAAVTTDAGQTGGKRPEPPSLERLAAAFPQLEVIQFIGQGGMGAVYKARQKQLDRIVALKVLPPGIGGDPAFAERFTREAKALAKLLHPNIVALFEFGQADGIYYLLMEFVDGVSLGQLLRSSRVSPREALAIVPQICDALQYAHDQGIVHRDIKPENILLDRRGRVKVADFGVAKLVGTGSGRAGSPLPAVASQTDDGAHGVTRPTEGLTDAGKVIGTPQYMAPEQTEHPGEVDHRADIYALGVVFYQMLTGELPGKSLEPPSSKVQIDVRLDEVVLRALERKPERRYQQASEVKTDVQQITAGAPALGQLLRQRDQAARPRKINYLPALSLYCLGIALFMAMNVAAVGSLDDIWALLPWAILAWPAAGLLWSILHHSCWKALPAKYRATPPAQALGFLFIPLFNFYWAFITFPKLATGFNALKRDRPELAIRNLRAMGIAYAISTVLMLTLGFIPGWGCLFTVGNLALALLFYPGIVANANLALEAFQPSRAPAAAPSTADDLVPVALAVRKRVRLASAVLFVAGCICLGEVVLLSLLLAMLPISSTRAMVAFFQSLQSGFLRGLARWNGPYGPYFGTLSPLVGALALVCAWQVRRLRGFALAITASGLLIPVSLWMFPLGPLLGLVMIPLGLLVVGILCQEEVRAAFSAQNGLEIVRGPSPTDARAGHGLALTSALLALFSVASAPIDALMAQGLLGVSGTAAILPALIFWLQNTANPASVMLGWLGLWAMRRAPLGGKGLGYAMLGISFAPILQVCRCVHPAAGAYWMQRELETGQIPTNMVLALLLAGLLGFGISAWKSRLASSGATASAFMHRLCWTMGIVVLVFAGTLVFRLPAMRSEAWSGNEASTSFYLNHQHVQAQPEGKRESFAGHTPLGSLEVQAVSDPEQKDWACWLPDGTPWCPQRQHPLPPGVSQRRPSRAVPEFLSLRKPDDKITRGVIFYLAGYGDLQTNLDYLRFECYVTNRGMEQPCADYRFGYQGRKNNRRGFVAGVPAEATAARVRLGVLAGKWEDTDAAWIWISDPRKLKPKSIRHADEDWDVSIRDVEATAGGLSASFTCLLRWNGTPRLVAVDAEGKVHEPVWPGGDAYSILAATREMMGFRIGHTLSFPGMDLAQLRELRFQIQPYVWTEFRNISLQPGQHTQVEIVDAGAK